MGRALPNLVSEYGSDFSNKEVDGTIKYSPRHDWWVLKGVVGKLMQFMSRPDTILKAIPFIITAAGWITNPEKVGPSCVPRS